MPRGVRNPVKSITDQISEIDQKIVNYQQKISNLSAKKKALQSSKEKAEMDALYKIVKQSGKSPAELISQMSNNAI